MNIRWADVARHYLQVLAFCCVVAVFTTLIWPGKSYWVQLGYAMCIGTITWGVIEFGRYFVDERHCHNDSARGHGWPKGWRGVLLSCIGIACGFVLGDRLGDLFLSTGVVNTPRDNRLGLAITILAGAIGTFYFHARGKTASMAAQINAAERDASEAKLKLLETQLEPHMLFNTLANLRVLIATDPPRAIAMLDRLNSYLRATLNGSRALSHPLDAEFDLLRDYLELMSVRMGDRLAYTLDLPDALRHAAVPPLLLQPLVENAIQHGLEPQVGGGRIAVRASQRGEGAGALLVVEVADTGVGLSPQADALARPGRGFGLTQVRERLASAYGERGAIELIAASAGGTCATATFPLKISP
jgi:signal transduction histidine kinase